MAIVNSHGMPVVGIPKNCPRCGLNYTDYTDANLMRLCPACKKPRTASKDLTQLLGQPLTFREVQIVNLVATGRENKEIAYELHLTEGTIKAFMSVILAKAGKANRTELAVWWVFKTNDTLTALVAAGMGPQ